jgi:DNA-binding response OmpR family regulator
MGTISADWSPPWAEAVPLRVDPITKQVWLDGTEVALTPREQQCFELLYDNRRSVVSRQQIVERVWGYEVGKDDLDELIYLLRRKIEPRAGERPRYLVTLRGKGYRLNL